MPSRIRKPTSKQARQPIRSHQYPQLHEKPLSEFAERKRRRRRAIRRVRRFLFHPPGIINSRPISSAAPLRLPKLSVLPFIPHPVWVQPQNNYGSNRWVVYSLKLDRFVILYSNLERDHWVLVESNPAILLFCEQPLRVSVRLATGTVCTIFDMWIRWRDGREELREVKYGNQLHGSARVDRQLEAQAKWCGQLSFPYSVITEEVIRANPIYLANWKRLLCYLGPRARADIAREINEVKSLLATFRILPIGQIESRLSHLDLMLVRTALYKLIHSGEARALGLDTRKLDGSTLVEEVRHDH